MSKHHLKYCYRISPSIIHIRHSFMIYKSISLGYGHPNTYSRMAIMFNGIKKSKLT